MIQFYTYLWLRADGTPYYVGKGCGNRAYSKNHGFNCPPKDIDRIRIIAASSEESAFESEKFLISYYGRKDLGTGILRNRTDGGEGVSSNTMKHLWQTPEYRAKASAAASRRGVLPETLAKAHAAIKGSHASSETKAKMSASGKIKIFTEEHRKHLSESATGRRWSEEQRASISGRIMSKETKDKIRDSKKGRPWSDKRRAAQGKYS